MTNSISDPIVIAGYARTPMGGLMGELSEASANELGGTAMKAALERSGMGAEAVDETIMGNVLMAGQGQAPGRQAGYHAGLGDGVPAVTINKMCGSGMKAAMMAHDQLLAGGDQVILAGGMESMSNAPYLLPKMRGGARFGHAEVLDHMKLDGLEDAYEGQGAGGIAMGCYAEDLAEKYQFSREDQDAFALESLSRAQKAQENGTFASEIASHTISSRKGDVVVDKDEGPRTARPDKIPSLRPAFSKDGTITAANASSINDGAAALVITRQSVAEAHGARITARIAGHASHSHEPRWFTTAPVSAMQKLMGRLGWQSGDVDLWEVNEAFAVVPMAAMRELNIGHDKLNVNGGACALGHPIGASGARILVTLLAAMEAQDVQTGMAALCIGGGEGVAMAVERV
ncbi:MAG: acetyl-CoA C-acyltransferase [Pseudomonadota bacterium]